MTQDDSIPPWESEDLKMVFILGLPCTHRQYDSIWVTIDRMTKSMHFILVKASYSAKDYVRNYTQEVVKLHSVPLSIISDRFGDHFRKDLVLKLSLAQLFTRRPMVTLLGPELVHEAMEKVQLIKDRLKTAQSRQKSYTGVRREILSLSLMISSELDTSKLGVPPAGFGMYETKVVNKAMAHGRR
ncbi:hypothetical protein MTR67_002214 [Solanum verrucosum]|uniref:Reverse transcriptase domain-containing protein n=1 Tax=Solanum verrucosum TaxID=315347 RepID=A0AAF0T8J5_SOLVR|nr:hypothetical protein MTR67_002214 [Solanum verrucosum]